MNLSRFLIPSFALSAVFLCSSCSTNHVKMDHTQLREVLMDYTEEQIMDNLVRAKNSRPIMHFDMTHVDALVKTSVSASLGGGHTSTSERSHATERSSSRSTEVNNSYNSSAYSAGSYHSVGRTLGSAASLAVGVVSTVVNPFSWGASGGRDNTVDVQMVPVLNEDGLYRSYETFVQANGGDMVRDSLHYPLPKVNPANPDDPDGIHVFKKWRNVSYWVPNKYRQKFFKLCLDVSLKRPNQAARQSASNGLLDLGSEIRRQRLSE